MTASKQSVPVPNFTLMPLRFLLVLHIVTTVVFHRRIESLNSSYFMTPSTASIARNTTLQAGGSKEAVHGGWIEEYAEWHRDTIYTIEQNHSQWQSYKYVVVRCLEIDTKCGGAADRLKSIPLILLMAHKHKRIIFIEWEKPYALTEFFTPVAIDWRIPQWMKTCHHGKQQRENDVPTLIFQRSPSVVSIKHLSRFESRQNDTLLDVRLQSSDYGESAFNQERTGLEFSKVYHILWSKMFKPSAGVKNQLQRVRMELRLPETYVALHIRTKFYKDKSNDTKAIENAIRCAAPLGNSLFIAGDAYSIVDLARSFVATEFPNLQLQTTLNKKVTPLHLDRGSDFLQHGSGMIDRKIYPVSAYYAIFVDLYLLSRALCVGYGIGGFGHWATLIAPTDQNSCRHFNYKRELCSAPSPSYVRGIIGPDRQRAQRVEV